MIEAQKIEKFGEQCEKMKICMVGFDPIESRSNVYFIRCWYMAQSLVEFGHEVIVLEFPEEKSLDSIEFKEGLKFVRLHGKSIRIVQSR